MFVFFFNCKLYSSRERMHTNTTRSLRHENDAILCAGILLCLQMQ